MSKLLAYIAGAIIAPHKTFAEIAADRPLAPAVAVFVLTTFMSGAVSTIGFPQDFPFNAAPLLLVLILGVIIFGVFGWFFQTAIYHLFAEFLGGSASALDLFTVLPFTMLPGVLLGPFSLLIRTVGGSLAAAPLPLILAIWVFVLQLYALRAVYRISLGRAAAVIILPVAITIVAFLIFGITLFTALAPIITRALPGLPSLFQI